MRGAIMMVLVAMACAAAEAKATPSSSTFFRTPSHNIACVYSHGGGERSYLRCDVTDPAVPAKRPQSCDLDYGSAFGLSPTERAQRLCVGDTARDPHARTLRYGTTKRFGPFTCTSQPTGLRCTTKAGHGFALSRQTQRLF